MRSMFAAVPTTAALLVTSCTRQPPPPAADGIPRIDGRTDAAFEVSIDRVRAGMTSAQIEGFTNACLRITLRGGERDPAAIARSIRTRLHGMSAAEILVAGAPTSPR
jgi:hypothetical protein